MTNSEITIAVPKGYLLKETVAAFAKAAIFFPQDFDASRRLFTYDNSGRFKLIMVRPWDVPAYVERGAADLGVAGQDVLYEQRPAVSILKNLHFGGCKLVIAGLGQREIVSLPHHCRVVTKYPESALRYFNAKGKKIRLIKLYGAIELGPLTGLSDVICDLTATGQTLKEHDLTILDTVFESTAHLIANPIGLRMHYPSLMTLLSAL